MSSLDQFPHHDPAEFLLALSHSSHHTGFSRRLIEKDYYCSLVLDSLREGFDNGLVFKGGTSLSKVHVGFYRLSEDLDFAISVEPIVSRRQRREIIQPHKTIFASLPQLLPVLRITQELAAHSESRQYLGRLGYGSVVTGVEEQLIVEISLREPIVLAPVTTVAKTLLVTPPSASSHQFAPTVTVLSVLETYAEKLRAALTRTEPKIRDLFDVAHAVDAGLIDLRDVELVDLTERKLAIRGNQSVDVSAAKLGQLRIQMTTVLQDVLRAESYQSFDLDRAFDLLTKFASRLSAR